MDTVDMILMLISVISIIGLVAFFVYTYMQDKDATDKRIQKTIDMVTTEKSDRLSNVKYVVDNVNTVNTDIYTTMMTSNQSLNTSLTSNVNMVNSINKNISGFGSIMRFVNTSNQQFMSLGDLPGVAGGGVNVQLLQNVVATMGLTGQNLSTYPVKLCGGTDQNNCIQFPNAAGDTYLTSMSAGKNIVLDAPTTVKGALATSNVVRICTTDGTKCSTLTQVGTDLKIAPPVGGNIILDGNTKMGTDFVFTPATTAGGAAGVGGGGGVGAAGVGVPTAGPDAALIATLIATLDTILGQLTTLFNKATSVSLKSTITTLKGTITALKSSQSISTIKPTQLSELQQSLQAYNSSSTPLTNEQTINTYLSQLTL